MSTQEAVAPERGAENELAPTIPGQADATVKVRPKKPLVEREVPYPGTAEGEVFHYTPEEAARFLPWSALQLKRKSYAREIPFNGGGGRITFTGLDIREISLMTAVRPLSEAEPVQQRSA